MPCPTDTESPHVHQLRPWPLSEAGKIITALPKQPILPDFTALKTEGFYDSILSGFALSKEGSITGFADDTRQEAGNIFSPTLFLPFPQHLTGFWHENQTASSAQYTWPLGF